MVVKKSRGLKVGTYIPARIAIREAIVKMYSDERTAVFAEYFNENNANKVENGNIAIGFILV